MNESILKLLRIVLALIHKLLILLSTRIKRIHSKLEITHPNKSEPCHGAECLSSWVSAQHLQRGSSIQTQKSTNILFLLLSKESNCSSVSSIFFASSSARLCAWTQISAYRSTSVIISRKPRYKTILLSLLLSPLQIPVLESALEANKSS